MNVGPNLKTDFIPILTTSMEMPLTPNVNVKVGFFFSWGGESDPALN